MKALENSLFQLFRVETVCVTTEVRMLNVEGEYLEAIRFAGILHALANVNCLIVLLLGCQPEAKDDAFCFKLLSLLDDTTFVLQVPFSF